MNKKTQLLKDAIMLLKEANQYLVTCAATDTRVISLRFTINSLVIEIEEEFKQILG